MISCIFNDNFELIMTFFWHELNSDFQLGKCQFLAIYM